MNRNDRFRPLGWRHLPLETCHLPLKPGLIPLFPFWQPGNVFLFPPSGNAREGNDLTSAMVERLWSIYNASLATHGHSFGPGERARVTKARFNAMYAAGL